MTLDARLNIGLPSHPKTKKLIRRLGAGAAWSLVVLILWARASRPSGDLAGMSDEDIEIAAEWTGQPDALVQTLADVRFLDGAAGQRRLHDWDEHNPWAAGSDARSEKARWAALCRRHGRTEAAKLMPGYAANLDAESPQDSMPPMPVASDSVHGAVLDLAHSKPAAAPSIAPSPSPSPSPSHKKGPARTPQSPESLLAEFGELLGGVDAHHLADWMRARKAAGAKPLTETAIKGLLREASRLGLTAAQAVQLCAEKQWRGLNAEWVDAKSGAASILGQSGGSQVRAPAWVTAAGFANVHEAYNERCYERNAHEFRDGRRIEVHA